MLRVVKVKVFLPVAWLTVFLMESIVKDKRCLYIVDD